MVGFKLQDGDVVIENGDIQTIDGSELLRQTVETVMGTNKGEWAFNISEGIAFSNILVKNPDMNAVRESIVDALNQCDSSFVLEDFSFKYKNERALSISFSARRSDNEIISGGYVYD